MIAFIKFILALFAPHLLYRDTLSHIPQSATRPRTARAQGVTQS